jgi:peptidyl-tRNA hydrolase
MTENPVLYVVLNGELNMSAGKGAAQAVHAAMLLEGNYNGLFVSAHRRTVVVLEAKDTQTIKNLHEYLEGADLYSAYYIDERDEKRNPYVVTALAVEPIDAEDRETRQIFSDFRLAGYQKKKWWELWK